MEVAATAVISRTHLWQWLHAGKLRFDGTATPIDFPLFDATLATVKQRLAATPMPGQARVARAAELLAELTHARELADFLTLAAYPELP
jgi:malate synthase